MKHGEVKRTVENFIVKDFDQTEFKHAKDFIQSKGLYYHTRMLKMLKQRCRELKIEYPFFTCNIPRDLILKENSRFLRPVLNKYIRRHNLVNDSECAICGMKNTWNNKPLVLILDHINGNSRDHRLENLRFVCPNCDHQLPTFAGKNVKGRGGATT